MVKTGILRTAIFILLFFAFTLAVMNVDVQPIGPEGSEVGFASLNGAVHNAFPYSGLWYQITSVLGYLALLCAGGFCLLGLAQFITRRSLKKVDFQLYALGLFYAAMLLCYVLFEKLVINYRPLILDAQEGLEASYPSSHTMLALCVFGALMVPYPQLMKGRAFAIVRMAALVLMAVSALGRLFSGVHWLTDVAASVLLSAALLSFYVCLLQIHRLRQLPPEETEDAPVDDGFGDLFRQEP